MPVRLARTAGGWAKLAGARQNAGICNPFANAMAAEAMRRLFDDAPEAGRLGNQSPLPAIFSRRSCGSLQ
ncbi:MAG: hypothetical protein ACQEUZ_03660 [Pseudomonadota bacterium]